jgi:hypothetical protein
MKGAAALPFSRCEESRSVVSMTSSSHRTVHVDADVF